jgi:hypothetical protein
VSASDDDTLVEAYLDGSLDAAQAATLAAALRAGGAPAARLRAGIAFAGLLGQALDPRDGDAVARAVDERISAEEHPSGLVRAVQRSIADGPRRTPAATRRSRGHSRPWPARALIASGLVLVLALAAWLLTSTPAPAIMRVVQVMGGRIERDGRALPARVGAPVYAGDAMHGGLLLRADDGSELVLGTDSTLQLPSAAGGPRAVLATGSVEARIAHQPAGAPFMLATRQAEVVVVGTHFTVAATADRTRLDLHDGAVRLVRRSDRRDLMIAAGQAAIITDGDAGALAVLTLNGAIGQPPATRALFPATGLDGWLAQHGQWSNRDGVVRGTGMAGGKARLLSQEAFGDLDLQCRLRITGVDHAELQVGDYNWFFTVPGGSGGWVTIHLRQVGESVTCTADGVPLQREAGDGRPARPGPLGWYVMPGGTIDISDARVGAP